MNTSEKSVFGQGIYEQGIYFAKKNGVHSKEYLVWNAMLSRCYSPYFKTKSNAYEGCTVSEFFKNFQNFAKWCNEQVGFNLEGYQLDKDILIPGNKIYSENTCVFVPRSLNCFSTKYGGEWDDGVSFHSSTGKFRARLQKADSKIRISLGLFKTSEEASEAYQLAKILEAESWAEMLDENKYVVDPRVITSMKLWKERNYVAQTSDCDA